MSRLRVDVLRIPILRVAGLGFWGASGVEGVGSKVWGFSAVWG